MCGSRNFRRGGGGGGQSQSVKKALTTFFLVLSLFYRSQLVNFKEIYHFFKIPEGVQHFPGGPTFSKGGGGGGVGGPIAYSL